MPANRKGLVRLHLCAGSRKALLVAYMISTIFSSAGSFKEIFLSSLLNQQLKTTEQE